MTLDTDAAQQTADNQDQKAEPAAKEEVPGWLAAVEDENLKGDATLKRFKTPHALAVSYKELRNKLGENPVAMPGEKDSPEKWDEFYTKLGRPDAPEKYAFQAPEGVQVNPDLDKGFRLEAHKLGLSQRQFEGIQQWVVGVAQEGEAAKLKDHNKRTEEAEAALKKEWAGDYEKNMNAANAALKRWGGPDVAKVLKDSGLDGSAAIVKFFASLAKGTLNEDELRGLSGRKPSTLRSRAQLEEMMKDPRYWKDSEYRAEIEKGFKILAGEATA